MSYYLGRPRCYLTAVRRLLLQPHVMVFGLLNVAFVGACVVCAVMFVGLCLARGEVPFADHPALSIAGTLAVVLGGLKSVQFIREIVAIALARQAILAPWFEERLGKGHESVHGRAIARSVKQLDAAALSVGVERISGFGFVDPWGGDLRWCDARRGVRCLTELMGLVSLEDGLRRELQLFVEALKHAEERGVRFCLMVSVGDPSNHDVCHRGGLYWR